MKKKRTALWTSLLALLLCLSMLVGTTFAWFTDSVTSGVNQIIAGNLDVDVLVNGKSIQGEEVLFDEITYWEPGVVAYENLTVTNLGTLALKYQLSINFENETKVGGHGLSEALKVGVVEGGVKSTTREAVLAEVKSWQSLANFTLPGDLEAKEEGDTYGIVIYWQPTENDNLFNMNNDLKGNTLSIDLGVKLLATQQTSEMDSFDEKYDDNAAADFFPGFQGGSAGAVVAADDQGVTTAEVAMDGGDVSAVVPAGVQVADGVSSLALSVTPKDTSDTNIQLTENEEMRPLDVHIEGVAEGNTVPMLITLEHYLTTGINTGALKLYHVENGTTVAMTQVDNPVNHNEFSYDPLTGDLTLALASFSEVATVADNTNTWDGTAANAFAGGTGTEADPYQIANADQLAYFRNQVDGGRNFSGEYVQLSNNITLSGVNFDPIGWGYLEATYNKGGAEGKVFMGTFDGNGKTIYGLCQSGWDLESTTGTDYTYTNCGFGLFAAAADATFKNLTIYGASVTVECVEAGILVGLSQGSCTYDNISIQHSKIANYQRPAGGLIGEVSSVDSTEDAPETTVITDVTIGADVVVGSLWGDFDTPCGGVIGARWDDANTTKVNMTNVIVHCEMDVYSDVTAAYRWYAYRRAGMLIGNTDLPAADGKNAKTAEAPFLTCSNVEVCYGDWANYHYCLFTNENNPGARYPWVRVEAGENNPAYSNPRYGHPVDADGNTVTTDSHIHQDGDTCGMELRFNQLYGGGQGVYGQPKHTNVEVVDYKYSITYINDSKVLSVKYVTNNSEAVSTANPAAQDLVEAWGDENIEYEWTFGGWMTAASAVIEKVDAGNTTDIVLYPYFQGVYTATFVDQSGTILAWELFAEGATALTKVPADPVLDGFVFDYWEIRSYNQDGTYVSKGELNATNLQSVTYDITLYPIYEYNGNVKLTPVDTDGDGDTDYYQVDGTDVPDNYSNLSTEEQLPYRLVDIPDYVNGIPVKSISANAFAGFEDLTAVVIPDTTTTIGTNALEDGPSNNIGGGRSQMTLYFEGKAATWKQYMDLFYGSNTDSSYTDYNEVGTYAADAKTILTSGWDSGLGDGSRIFFLDENDNVINDCYWELCIKKYNKYLGFQNSGITPEYVWIFHNHPYVNTADGYYQSKDNCMCTEKTSNAYPIYHYEEYTDYTADDRIDRDYWTTTE